MLLPINGHLAFHCGEHASFQVGRAKLRIGFEAQESLISLLSRDAPNEGVRKDLQKLCSLLVVVLTALALFVLSARVIDEGTHLLALLILGEGPAISLDDAFQAHRMSFGDPLLHTLLGFAIPFEIEPMTMVVA